MRPRSVLHSIVRMYGEVFTLFQIELEPYFKSMKLQQMEKAI